jgi:hypothetical protein
MALRSRDGGPVKWSRNLAICAICGRTPRADENAEDNWRSYNDGVGDGVSKKRYISRA